MEKSIFVKFIIFINYFYFICIVVKKTVLNLSRYLRANNQWRMRKTPVDLFFEWGFGMGI